METWNLYVKPVYQAAPWPWRESWDDFLANPKPLERACDHLTRPSPCDGLSETPTVPPHLPRPLPRGRHRFACYHDPDWFYAFLESEDAPPVAEPDDLRRGPQLAGRCLWSRCLSIFSADTRTLFRFGHNDREEPLATAAATVYGPRRRTPAPWTPRYAFRVVRSGAAELACWRIARESLAFAWAGDSLRLSLSRLAFPSMDAAAWGSIHVWDPRPDEAGLVRLVPNIEKPDWAELERLDMDYDPATETAAFRARWSNLPGPDETFAVPRGKGFRERPVPWQSCSIRAAGPVSLHPLAETVRTDPAPLPDGISRVQVAAPAGPAVTLHLEKRSGNRIVLPAWLDSAEVGDEGLRAFPSRLEAECEAAVAAFRERRAAGVAPEYAAWCTYHASSYGRAWEYGIRVPGLLDLFKEQAELALSLQRTDGTFSALHLRAAHGAPAVRWQGGAYDTGPAGELYAVAARLLDDNRYRDASERLLRAYRGYRVEYNHNYSAFALYHLAEQVRLTGDPEALEHGLYYCRTSAAEGILPLGFQGGHNYYTCYGAITLRGMCQFCGVLPQDHPYRPVLLERCVRMANQLLSRLQPDGLFDSMDRYFLGERQGSFGLFSLALVAPADQRPALDKAIRFLLARKLARTRAAEGWDRWCENDLILYMKS